MPKRRFLQFHLLTAVVVMLAGAASLGLNLSPFSWASGRLEFNDYGFPLRLLCKPKNGGWLYRYNITGDCYWGDSAYWDYTRHEELANLIVLWSYQIAWLLAAILVIGVCCEFFIRFREKQRGFEFERNAAIAFILAAICLAALNFRWYDLPDDSIYNPAIENEITVAYVLSEGRGWPLTMDIRPRVATEQLRYHPLLIRELRDRKIVNLGCGLYICLAIFAVCRWWASRQSRRSSQIASKIQTEPPGIRDRPDGNSARLAR